VIKGAREAAMEDVEPELERGLQQMIKQYGRANKDDERSASAAMRELAWVLSSYVARFGKSTVRRALKNHPSPTPSGGWEPMLVLADDMNRDKDKLFRKPARRKR
jgi:hypothetical protein